VPLERHFGPGGVDLADQSGVRVSILAGLDHDLTGRAMRQRAGNHMIDFLKCDDAVRSQRPDGCAEMAIGTSAAIPPHGTSPAMLQTASAIITQLSS